MWICFPRFGAFVIKELRDVEGLALRGEESNFET